MGQRVSIPLIVGDGGLAQCLREIELTEWSQRWEQWLQQEQNSGNHGQRRESRVDQETIQKIIEPVLPNRVVKILMDLYEASYRNEFEENFTVDVFEFFGTLTAFADGSLADKVELWFEKKNYGTSFKTVHSLQLLLMLSCVTKGIYYLSFIHPPPVAYLEKILTDDRLFTVDDVMKFLQTSGSVYLNNFKEDQSISKLREQMGLKVLMLRDDMITSTDENILEPRHGKIISELPYSDAEELWKKYVVYDPIMMMEIHSIAEEKCRSVMNIGFSKTRDADELFDDNPDHRLYINRDLATREDLVLMLIPAMACNLLDPYGSDLFSSRHFGYLADLCSITGIFNLPPLKDLIPFINTQHGTFTTERFVQEAAVFTLLEERRSYENYLLEEFSKYDADSSGTVERAELEESIRTLIGTQVQLMPNEDPVLLDILIQSLCEEVLEEVDEDKSEVVSFPEFKKGIRIIQHKFQTMASNRVDGLLPLVESLLAARLGDPEQRIKGEEEDSLDDEETSNSGDSAAKDDDKNSSLKDDSEQGSDGDDDSASEERSSVSDHIALSDNGLDDG
eukprot:GEMP01017981.1.p1 GENE.GEMP01017981.1~~GEMP01017981.1.p1  ORF type:complete len:564 (+),score=119.95 GEMP01017981.1:76-1767(+)